MFKMSDRPLSNVLAWLLCLFAAPQVLDLVYVLLFGTEYCAFYVLRTIAGEPSWCIKPKAPPLWTLVHLIQMIIVLSIAINHYVRRPTQIRLSLLIAHASMLTTVAMQSYKLLDAPRGFALVVNWTAILVTTQLLKWYDTPTMFKVYNTPASAALARDNIMATYLIIVSAPLWGSVLFYTLTHVLPAWCRAIHGILIFG